MFLPRAVPFRDRRKVECSAHALSSLPRSPVISGLPCSTDSSAPNVIISLLNGILEVLVASVDA